MSVSRLSKEKPLALLFRRNILFCYYTHPVLSTYKYKFFLFPPVLSVVIAILSSQNDYHSNLLKPKDLGTPVRDVFKGFEIKDTF